MVCNRSLTELLSAPNLISIGSATAFQVGGGWLGVSSMVIHSSYYQLISWLLSSLYGASHNLGKAGHPCMHKDACPAACVATCFPQSAAPSRDSQSLRSGGGLGGQPLDL
jgi:hypothetical protein